MVCPESRVIHTLLGIVCGNSPRQKSLGCEGVRNTLLERKRGINSEPRGSKRFCLQGGVILLVILQVGRSD